MTEFFDTLRGYIKDEHAHELCCNLIAIANIWDDLVDHDRVVGETEINQAFWMLLVAIPENPFYQAYQYELRPLIKNIILKWQDSTIMERSGDEHDMHLAYGLRAGLLELINYIVLLLYGYKRATEIGVELRRLNDEKMEDFIKEFSQCQGQP